MGGVRLRRTGDPQILERAHEAGARTVRADTTAGKAAAVGLLRELGAVVTVDGDPVRAEIPLRE